MRITAYNTHLGSLRRLRDADLEVAPHEHDVWGWKVVLANEAIGKVDDLINRIAAPVLL